jgi:hypothetical protein
MVGPEVGHTIILRRGFVIFCKIRFGVPARRGGPEVV